MSIDLDWDKLDSSLSSTLVDALNRQLASTNRPSFIGPVEITSFEFGSSCPDVELLDMRDIYRDFLEEDDGDRSQDLVKVTRGLDDDGFEWVSRRAVSTDASIREGNFMPAYHHLPPYVRYSHGRSPEIYSSAVSGIPSPRELLAGGSSGLASSPRPTYTVPPLAYHPSALTTPASPAREPSWSPARPTTKQATERLTTLEDASHHPHHNLQLHLHVTWHSNLRLALSTSLLINYPSPMFMSLPIKLSVTGILFNGEVVIAYEGERRRVHLCILDDLDPYGPAGDRSKRNSLNSLPIDLEDDPPPAKSTKPSPVGLRLLPSIEIESEIGQADKHVLKNVTRVERFIQDVIRKTVEEELVFPNFHTLLMEN